MEEISEPRYGGKQNKRDGDQLYHPTLELGRALHKRLASALRHKPENICSI